MRLFACWPWSRLYSLVPAMYAASPVAAKDEIATDAVQSGVHPRYRRCRRRCRIQPEPL